MAPPPPPELLIEELVEEVLLRFPPDDPGSLVRAALVCRLWRRLVSAAAFRRRFLDFHRGARGPPLLGVFYTNKDAIITDAADNDDTDTDDDDDDDDIVRPVKRARILPPCCSTSTPPFPPAACFVPTTESYRPAAAQPRDGWRAIDAHHGRVLLSHCQTDRPRCCGLHLSVWDPVTGAQHDLPECPLGTIGYSAAVVCACAADGRRCDHIDDCRSFLVVAIDVQTYAVLFSVYSSEAGEWSNTAIMRHPYPAFCFSSGNMKRTPGLLLATGRLYFLVHFKNEIVEFNLATHKASMIGLPTEFFRAPLQQHRRRSLVVLITADDGGLGLAVLAAADNNQHQLELWSMVGDGDDFVPTRVIQLQDLLPPAALVDSSSKLEVNGFADGAGGSRLLFMTTSDGLYSVDLNNSCHVVRKVVAADDYCGCAGGDVVPYISFCTPNESTDGDGDGDGDDVRTSAAAVAAAMVQVQAPMASAESDSSARGAASPDARPTTDTQDDGHGLQKKKIVPRRRPRTQNPRFYGLEWVNK